MKIEKVKNGYIVEIEVEIASTIGGGVYIKPVRHICHDLTDLLNFVNSHYGKEGYSVVEIKEEVSQ